MYSEAEGLCSSSEDVFKQSFKRYKSRKNDIDLSEVIDFQLFHQHKCDERGGRVCEDAPGVGYKADRISGDLPKIYSSVKAISLHWQQSTLTPQSETNQDCDPSICLKPISEWGVYEHDRVPGLVFIVDPFKNADMKNTWIKQCLTEYPQKPNICNFDAHSERTSDLWTDYLAAMKSGGRVNRTEFFKLRWVTLGYQYDWNTKLYYKERYSEFPANLYNLTKYLAACLGYKYYSAEAGIVNYYHLDSTLAGHTDHSEFDMESPLFSLSFGCDAIFLIGGASKSVEPVPIYLRNGDIVVMAGESRMAYHAVPKIITPTDTTEHATYHKDTEFDDEQNCERRWIDEYMKQSRININVRQVLKEGQEFPESNS